MQGEDEPHKYTPSDQAFVAGAGPVLVRVHATSNPLPVQAEGGAETKDTCRSGAGKVLNEWSAESVSRAQGSMERTRK